MSAPFKGFEESAHAPYTPPGPMPLIQTVELAKGGRVVIPAAMRAALGVKEGELLLLEMAGDELRIISFATNLQRIQTAVMALAPPEISFTDEVIADRRREAVKEWDEAILGPLPEALQAYR